MYSLVGTAFRWHTETHKGSSKTMTSSLQARIEMVKGKRPFWIPKTKAINTLSVPVTPVSAKWKEQLLHCCMVCAQFFLGQMEVDKCPNTLVTSHILNGCLYKCILKENTCGSFKGCCSNCFFFFIPHIQCFNAFFTCWQATGKLGKLWPCSAAVAKHEAFHHGPRDSETDSLHPRIDEHQQKWVQTCSIWKDWGQDNKFRQYSVTSPAQVNLSIALTAYRQPGLFSHYPLKN